ncbi:MAG: CRTAC1 family protein [Myxococcales bacterium]|nr:CRTAC1 family protein [Myxococcales bacterium]
MSDAPTRFYRSHNPMRALHFFVVTAALLAIGACGQDATGPTGAKDAGAGASDAGATIADGGHSGADAAADDTFIAAEADTTDAATDAAPTDVLVTTPDVMPMDTDAGAADAGDASPDDAELSDVVVGITDAKSGDAGNPDGGATDGQFDAEAMSDGAEDALELSDGLQADAAAMDSDGSDATQGDATGGDVPLPGDATADGVAVGLPDPWAGTSWPTTVTPMPIAKLPQVSFTTLTKLPKGLLNIKEGMMCAASGYLDGDDHLDIVVVGAEDWAKPRLIVSMLSRKGGPTTVVTKAAETLHVPDGSCAVFDVDGDKDDDLVVGGQSGVFLYLNNGSGGFYPSPQAFPGAPNFFGWSLAPADFDGDGDLDLYVGSGLPSAPCDAMQCTISNADFMCSMKPGKTPKKPMPDRLYIQYQPGKFVDATSTWNIAPGGEMLTSLSTPDLDGDGLADVVIGDDFGSQRALRNTGKKLVPWKSAGFADHGHTMGWGIGDLNGDGWLDLVMADAGPARILLRAGTSADGSPAFALQPAGHPATGLSWSSSSWNPLLEDFDQDGHLDILLGVAMDWGSQPISSLKFCGFPPKVMTATDLWLFGTGKVGVFKSLRGPTYGCGNWGTLSHGVADLDLDGDLDLVQLRPSCSGALHLYVLMNDLKVGNVAVVRVIGKAGNRDALGAIVDGVVAGKSERRWIIGNVGIGTSGQRQARFGLGKATEVSQVVVTWPGGKKTKVGTVKAGELAVVKAP